MPVNTTSKSPSTAARASRTSDCTQRASNPARPARRAATSSDAAEKSRPVTRAPARASERVSVPMWHCRWMTSSPATEPPGRNGASTARSSRTQFWVGSFAKASAP